jgi:hypothetical protein
LGNQREETASKRDGTQQPFGNSTKKLKREILETDPGKRKYEI